MRVIICVYFVFLSLLSICYGSSPHFNVNDVIRSSREDIADSVSFYGKLICAWRAGLHSLRDIMFPEYRDPYADLPHRGIVDRGFDGETPLELALRMRYRDNLLGTADSYGIPKFYSENPDAFRYGLAIIIGLVGLTIVCLGLACSKMLSRCFMRLMFKLTKDEGWDIDHEGDDFDPNVFNRMFTGPIEYEFDPRLSPAERIAFRETMKVEETQKTK